MARRREFSSKVKAEIKRPIKSICFRWLEGVLQRPETDDCIEWPFSVRENGYGQIMLGYRRTTAHRVICEWVHGEPPSDGDHAAHSCQSRRCCNPKHLRWATPKENAADKVAHGTHRSGDNCPASILTSDEVRRIRSLAATGRYTLTEIGDMFGVTGGTVWDIKTRKSWRHLSDAA